MSDHRVMSQYHSFVIVHGSTGATRQTYALDMDMMQLCSLWLYGAHNRGSRNGK